jgi:hypothetical protein
MGRTMWSPTSTAKPTVKPLFSAPSRAGEPQASKPAVQQCERACDTVGPAGRDEERLARALLTGQRLELEPRGRGGWPAGPPVDPALHSVV